MNVNNYTLLDDSVPAKIKICHCKHCRNAKQKRKNRKHKVKIKQLLNKQRRTSYNKIVTYYWA